MNNVSILRGQLLHRLDKSPGACNTVENDEVFRQKDSNKVC